MGQSALVAALNSQWFFRSRFGPIEAAKKLLVPDLGVCLFGGELICTTHVGFLNLGMDEGRAVNWNPRRLSREVSAMAEAIGRYTATTLDLLGQPVGRDDEHASQTAGSVKWKNMRSARMYGRLDLIEGSRRDAVAVLLTSLLAAANTARILVPLVSPGNVTSELKWQYVTLFHLTLCIMNLLDLGSRESVLRPALRECLSELVVELPRPTKKRKELRNVFMHYGIAGEVASRLVPDGPLCGLVEAYLGEFSYEEFEAEVRNGLDQAARVLGSLMPSNVVGNRAKPRHV
jgi:hypothetical protein